MSILFEFGLAALLLAGQLVAAVAQTSTDRVGCMGAFLGGGWGHMFVGDFMMLFFRAGLVALIAVAVRWVVSGSADDGQSLSSVKTARQILDERFARGEIDRVEFEDRKTALAS
jgi:putative membrane protein